MWETFSFGATTFDEDERGRHHHRLEVTRTTREDMSRMQGSQALAALLTLVVAFCMVNGETPVDLLGHPVRFERFIRSGPRNITPTRDNTFHVTCCQQIDFVCLHLDLWPPIVRLIGLYGQTSMTRICFVFDWVFYSLEHTHTHTLDWWSWWCLQPSITNVIDCPWLHRLPH